MIKRSVLTMVFATVAVLAWSAPLVPGLWMQTSSTAGDCAGCSLEVRAPSTHLREVHASNGWVAYLRYEPEQDQYTGVMELTREPDPQHPDWRGVVFAVTAVVDAHTLTIHARAATEHPEFRATYRRRE